MNKDYKKKSLLDYLINGFTNRLKNWYDAMPHVTEHTPKVSTRSVNPYARESLREKRQQDRRTDGKTDRWTDRQTQTDRPKPLFSTFWGLYILNPVLSQSRFFARCQYFHWHGSNTEPCTASSRSPVFFFPRLNKAVRWLFRGCFSVCLILVAFKI